MFLSVLDYTFNLPVSIQKAVNKEPVHAWDEAMETQGQDIAPYGVYITNKTLQSLVGSTTNELTRVERNTAWLAANKNAHPDSIQLRKDWIESSVAKAGMFRTIFNMVKKVQQQMLDDDAIEIYDVSHANYDSEAWRPTEFVQFPYDEARARAEAKAKKLKPSAIDARVELDKITYHSVSQQMLALDEFAPSDDLYYRYAQNLLKTTSSYYDRCIAKKNEHYQLGKDGLSEDAGTRAEYLAAACNGIAKTLKSSYELVEDGLH